MATGKFKNVFVLISMIALLAVSQEIIYADDFDVKIPQGASNRLCATFHNCYTPESLSINTGDTVKWTNEDSEPHTVTSGKPGASDGKFDSGFFYKGESWSFTFNQSGTYDYWCTIHPWMLGKITVTGESIVESELSIPQWIKTNARWWAASQISDEDFAYSIEYLIQHDMIKIPDIIQPESDTYEPHLPIWLKRNAGWWSQGDLTDEEFARNLQWMIVNGFVKI